MLNRLVRLCGLVFLALVPVAVLQAEESRIRIEDLTGRGFDPDLVLYRLEKPLAQARTLRVQDAQGKAVPTQVVVNEAGAVNLALVTSVAPGGAVEYTLVPEGAMPAATQLSASAGTEGLELSNRRLAVRLPAAQERTFDPAVAASSLPAPILAFRTGDSGWLGAGSIKTERAVKALRVEMVQQGPVFVEVRYELEWAQGGYYRAQIRVIDQVPLVKVREEFDLGTLDGTDFWELDLAAGWKPDQLEIASTAGNGGVDQGRFMPLERLGMTPQPMSSKFSLTPGNAWGVQSHLGLTRSAEAELLKPGAQPAEGAQTPWVVGFAPLHKGDWRRLITVEIRRQNENDLRLGLPMTLRQADWIRDCASETSPFGFKKHDPNLPATYGRRVWGLVLGLTNLRPKVEARKGPAKPIMAARLLYGVVGLDRYKDFILDWDTDEAVAYPRVFISQDKLEQYRGTYKQSPLASDLAQWYCLTGDVAKAQARLETLKKRLNFAKYMLCTPTSGHHHQIEWLVQLADDVLSWPDLPDTNRRWIRRRLALLAYLHMEPDYSAQGSGDHAGPANMGLARQLYFPLYVAMVPDHPMYEQWKRYANDNVLYHLGTNQAPGGGWSEYGVAYHFHGYKAIHRGMAGLIAMQVKDLDTILAYNRDNWEYVINALSAPDPQWFCRIMPGLANSPTGFWDELIEAVGTVAEVDPELAGAIKWAWQQNGGGGVGSQSLCEGLERPWIEPKRPNLRSKVMPGIGMHFRAHQGPQETWMWLRSGYFWGHWPVDQGHMMLSSKGAVMLPMQSFQYWFWTDDWDRHNLLRFGHPNNKLPHSWPDANVLDAAVGSTAEYAWSSIGFPDWYITPGKSAPYRRVVDAPVGTGADRPLAEGIEQKQGPFWWDRQIVFMKGETATAPNYFVIRDSMQGEGRLASWMFWNFLGREENVTATEKQIRLDTEFAAELELHFAEAIATPDIREEDHGLSVNHLAQMYQPWFDLVKGKTVSPHWFYSATNKGPEGKRAVNLPREEPTTEYKSQKAPNHEEHVFLRMPGQPGRDYLYVLYPKAATEASPAVTPLAAGVIQVQTGAGTDTVFAHPHRVLYEQGDLLCDGVAGAVRVTDDHVTLALLSGTGRVGYKGYVLSGTAPLERTVALAELKATVVAAEQEAPEMDVQDGDIVIVNDAVAPVTQGPVRGMARRAVVRREGEAIRFIVPTADYAMLTVGTVGIRGVGPFDLTFTPSGITGTVQGRTRTLVATWPQGVVRPAYHLDGQRYYAQMADDHCISKEAETPQFAVAFGVTAGEHRVEIGEWTYPVLPATPRCRTAPMPAK